MAYYRDLREYLNALESRGKLIRLKREINKDTQLHPLVRLQYRGLPEEKRKAFLFENVIDSNGKKYDIPVVVAALAGSSEIYAIGMMCQPEKIADRLTKAALNPIDPKLVHDGPVQEEVFLGDSLLERGGLSEFPIPVTTPGYDCAPYITAPYFVTKDPDTGVPNVGMYRAMLKSPIRTGVMFAMPEQHAMLHWRKCRDRGVSLEAAIVIGGAPNIGYVSVYRLPIGVNEFSVAGGIAGDPVEVVKCKTVDLEVPAYAEIVIEGEIGTEELEPEAPFGEALGFIAPPSIMPNFTVKCITHRKKPIWLATLSQYPPSESSKMRQFANEAIVFKHLKYDLKMEHVLSLAFIEAFGSQPLLVIQLKRTDANIVWDTLEAAGSRFAASKIIIAVDEDVNPRDMDAVNMAICTRSQPHRDYRILRLPPVSKLDYSLYPPEDLTGMLGDDKDAQSVITTEASKVLINATMKWALPPLSLPKKQFMEEALRIWQEEGLPQLTLKEPWWGVNLGCWNDELEELANAAVQGKHYKAGELYSQRKRKT